jgi:hypothetical protein
VLIFFNFKSSRLIEKLVLENMRKLNMNPNKYEKNKKFSWKTSYVLINPPIDFRLQTGDIIYLIKPGDVF